MSGETFSYENHIAQCAAAQSAQVWAGLQLIGRSTAVTAEDVTNTLNEFAPHEPPLRLFRSREFDTKSARKIGEGTFSTVFIIHHRRLGENVALKRIKKDIPYKYTMDECELLNKIQHHRVVKLMGWFFEGRAYVVLEACLGELWRYTMTMSSRDKHRAYIQVMDGLAYIHSKDIIHCDLKLQNILVTSDFNFKISDFGDAADMKGFDFISRTRKAGTCVFQNLDILLNAKYSKRSDLWAMGCTIWCAEMNNHLLVRCGNVEQETSQHVAKCITDGIPITRDGKTEPLMDRINRCTYKAVIHDLMFNPTMTAERFGQIDFIMSKNKLLDINAGNLDTSLEKIGIATTIDGRKSKTISEEVFRLTTANISSESLVLARFYNEAKDIAELHSTDRETNFVNFNREGNLDRTGVLQTYQPDLTPELIIID